MQGLFIQYIVTCPLSTCNIQHAAVCVDVEVLGVYKMWKKKLFGLMKKNFNQHQVAKCDALTVEWKTLCNKLVKRIYGMCGSSTLVFKFAVLFKLQIRPR